MLQLGQRLRLDLAAAFARHAEETGSVKARQMLNDWGAERLNFLKVCPKEMPIHIPRPLGDEPQAMPAEWRAAPCRRLAG